MARGDGRVGWAWRRGWAQTALGFILFCPFPFFSSFVYFLYLLLLRELGGRGKGSLTRTVW